MQSSPPDTRTIKQLAGEAALAKKNWSDESACIGYDVNMWFSAKDLDIAKAKAICFRCPVQYQCLELALLSRENFGIWGGLDTKERSKLWKHVNSFKTMHGRAVFETKVFIAKLHAAISEIVSKNKVVEKESSSS